MGGCQCMFFLYKYHALTGNNALIIQLQQICVNLELPLEFSIALTNTILAIDSHHLFSASEHAISQ